MKYYLYILQSLDNLHFYIGASKNIDARLEKHNKGSSKSTRPYRPWQLIYSEELTNRQAAMKREYFLKSPNGYLEKKSLIDDNKRG